MVEPGKNPTRTAAAFASAGKRKSCVMSAVTGRTFKLREIRPQFGRFLLDHLAADVDRHVGGERTQRAQQNARLLARARAEFDQRRARRNKLGDIGGVLAQYADFATGSGNIPAAR